jgi:ATP-binding protein involved in chromosome partitioning
LEDARKAVTMFQQVKVPVLGIVENMSYLSCPHCSQRIDVFSHGGGRRTAHEMQVHFLAELPLDPEIRIGGDTGEPIARKKDHGEPFAELARNVIARLEATARETGPTMEITD